MKRRTRRPKEPRSLRSEDRLREHQPAHPGSAHSGAKLRPHGRRENARAVPARRPDVDTGADRPTRAQIRRVHAKDRQAAGQHWRLRDLGQRREGAVRAIAAAESDGGGAVDRRTARGSSSRWTRSGNRGNRASPTARCRLESMKVYVDPRAEWEQMFREVGPHRARLLLRSQPARREPEGADGDVSAVRRQRDEPRRPELHFCGHARRNHRAARLHFRRRPAGSEARQRRPAGRGLHHRSRSLPLRQGVLRRKLESRTCARR